MVEFTTLEDSLYAGLKNDLGFIIDEKFLVLSEAQSTINNNMPLRQLEYISRTYEKLVPTENLYGESNTRIPVPELFVVYTGKKKWNASELRLSDSFLGIAPEYSLEVVVKIVKMKYNKGENETLEILERSEKLNGYSTLQEYIRQFREKDGELGTAIDKAVRQCIREGVLKEFLEKNSPEVKRMLFNEITSEEFAEIRAKEAAQKASEESYKEGIKEGKVISLIETCQEFGLSQKDTLSKLMNKLSMSKEKAEAYVAKFWK